MEGLERRVAAVSDRVSVEGTLAEVVTSLVTIGGSIEWSDGYAALDLMERCLLDALLTQGARQQNTDSSGSRPRVPQVQVALGRNGQGRTRVATRPQDAAWHRDVEVVRTFKLDVDLYETAQERYARDCELERVNLRLMHAWLLHEFDNGRLEQRCIEAADHIRHVESVAFLIGDESWHKNDGRNERKRTLELRDLADKPIASWTDRDVLLVSSINLLFATGGSTRFEEFSSRQLLATEVLDFIDRLGVRYDVDAEYARHPSTLHVFARQVGSARLAALSQGNLLFRRINGITLAKREAVLPKFQKGVSSTAFIDHLEESLEVFKSYQARASLDVIESHLRQIVEDAVDDIGADYGMTSGPKSLDPFRGNAVKARKASVDGKRAEFFCCCIPSPSYRESNSPTFVAQSMYRVAKRMQYNRWHFVPGNFDDIPENRHYYYPPLLPDIATMSDLRHGGHIDSHVKHAIRIPGPLAIRPPFSLDGVEYRGFFDLRLVRVEDQPFTIADLVRTAEHSLRVEAFWAVARDAGVDTEWDLFPKSYYDRMEGSEVN